MILLGGGLSADGMMRSEVERRRWDDVLGIYSAKRMLLKAGNIHSREAGIKHSRDAQIMVSVAACWQINTHSTAEGSHVGLYTVRRLSCSNFRGIQWTYAYCCGLALWQRMLGQVLYLISETSLDHSHMMQMT